MKLFLVALSLIILASCAQTGSLLTGGKKDTTAPRINTEKSIPKQGQLNYMEPKVTLFFDEYIVLKNPSNTISITPQPNVEPTISAKNKKFELVFNEPLLPNTTYSIAFNGAITDLNEGNDSVFQYVFSTGSYIDSLSFSGKVTNAFTNNPEENILIGLYPEIQDSIPYKIKPTYITQTNKLGEFELNYIKTGTYNAFAFSDVDRNLLFNPNTEKIAFLSSSNCCFETRTDSNHFRLFELAKSETGLKSASLYYPGQLNLIFKEKEPAPIEISYNTDLIQEETSRQDSLVYWLTTPFKSGHFFVLEQNGLTDTIRPIMKNLPKRGKTIPLTVSNNLHENKVLKDDTLSFTFSESIEIVDETLIRVLDADSNLVEYSSFIRNARTLQILPVTDSAKNVILDSAAIQSILTKSVNNTVSINYDKHEQKYYGLIFLKLTADSSFSYVLELLDMDNKVVKTQIVKSGNTVEFKDLLPGNYQMRLIRDEDNDGLWSTGKLLEQKQPERVYYYDSPIKVRSNWDLDIEWVLENTEP